MSIIHLVCLLSALFSIEFHAHRIRSGPLLLLSTIRVQYIGFVYVLQTFSVLLRYKGGKSGHQKPFLFTICRQIYKIQNTETSRIAFTKCVFLQSYELQNTKCSTWNACRNAPFSVCCMIVFVGVLFTNHKHNQNLCPYFIYILCTKVGIERRFYSCFYVFVPLSTHFLINLSFLSFLALNLRPKNKEKWKKKNTSKLNQTKRKEKPKRKPPHMVCSGLQLGSVLNDMSLVM